MAIFCVGVACFIFFWNLDFNIQQKIIATIKCFSFYFQCFGSKSLLIPGKMPWCFEEDIREVIRPLWVINRIINGKDTQTIPVAINRDNISFFPVLPGASDQAEAIGISRYSSSFFI